MKSLSAVDRLRRQGDTGPGNEMKLGIDSRFGPHRRLTGKAFLSNDSCIIERMVNSSTRLVVYSGLMTLAVGLMLLGIVWLMLLGVAFALLACCFSLQRRPGARPLIAFVVCLALAVVSLTRHLSYGDAFARESLPFWHWITLPVIWLWAIVGEFRAWRKGRALI